MRPKVKALLPKLVEAISFIAVDSLDNNAARRTGSTSHGRHQGWAKHQDSCRRHARSQAISSLPCLVGTKPTSLLAEDLTECLPEDSNLIGDKAYDSSALRQTPTAKGVKTCIRGRTNRTTTVAFSAKLCRRRHRVENFFPGEGVR